MQYRIQEERLKQLWFTFTTVKLRDAFPKNVNPIQLSFSSQENLKLSVELAFSS